MRRRPHKQGEKIKGLCIAGHHQFSLDIFLFSHPTCLRITPNLLHTTESTLVLVSERTHASSIEHAWGEIQHKINLRSFSRSYISTVAADLAHLVDRSSKSTKQKLANEVSKCFVSMHVSYPSFYEDRRLN